MKIINSIAGSCLFLCACTTDHIVDVRYEKQTIPQDLLEEQTPPICDAGSQTKIGECLLKYDFQLNKCNRDKVMIKEVVK